VKNWKIWLGVLVAYLAAPPLLSALLRPLARSCREDTSVPILFGIRFEFYECDFGYPQPLEFLAFTLASGSHTMALFAFIALGMLSLVIYMFWVLYRY